MDLRIELENKTQCNIEIQLQKYEYEKERFLWYWANTYTRQLNKGDDYNELKKTISIIILNHELEDLKEMQNLYTKWQIRDNITGRMLLTDQLEICIIEIPKAIREYKKNHKNKIGQWMMFFDNPNGMEVSRIMKENANIEETKAELEVISGDKELRRIVELKEKGMRDYRAGMNWAKNAGYKEGIEEGIEQGIEKGINKKQIEIVKNMLNENIEIDIILKVTGLTIEEIEKIKNDI